MRRLLLAWFVLTMPFVGCCQVDRPQVAQRRACVATSQNPLLTGAEVLVSNLDSKYAHLGRVAVVGNHTSVVGTTHLVDTLVACGVQVVRLFSPEHGFRGTSEAGAHVDNGVDKITGLPVVSLYGASKKPTLQQLRDIDHVLFDLQDVGCRFYTYLSTLHYVMEACAESNVPLIVLDRPNPNGHYVDGPVLDTSTCRSFVGLHPVPVVYGMTIGEYAQMINGEAWLKGGVKCKLTVVQMHGYERDGSYPLSVPPSPNLRNAHAVALYPNLCLLEGTTVSVGRGTPYPFEVIGTAPDTLDLRNAVPPACFSLQYVLQMMKRTPRGHFFLKNNFFDKLAGTTALRQQLLVGTDSSTIRSSWQSALDAFRLTRQKYLLYPDTNGL